MCELCPRKDMFKKSYNVIGMFFKECIWTVESAQTVLPKPNPVNPALRAASKRRSLSALLIPAVDKSNASP